MMNENGSIGRVSVDKVLKIVGGSIERAVSLNKRHLEVKSPIVRVDESEVQFI